MNSNTRRLTLALTSVIAASAIALVWSWMGAAGVPEGVGPPDSPVNSASTGPNDPEGGPLAVERSAAAFGEPAPAPDPIGEREPGTGPSLEVEFGEGCGTILVLDDQGRTERESTLFGTDSAPHGEGASWSESGSLLIAGLTPGKKKVVYWNDWLSASHEEIDVRKGTATVRLTVPAEDPLNEEVDFSGRVVDVDGYPIPGALARVRVQVADPFVEDTPSRSLAEYEHWGAGETLLGSRVETRRQRLESDGFVTFEGKSDLFGFFSFWVPGSLGAPIEVEFVVGDCRWVRKMSRPNPAWGVAVPDEEYEEIMLEEVPSAFPGLVKADRERYIYTLLGRLERGESARVVQESEEGILAWIRGLRDLPEHREYAADLDRLERLVGVVFDDLVEAGKEKPVPGDLVFDVTAREEVIRRLVCLVRDLIDFLARDEYEYEYEKEQAAHSFYSGMDWEEFERRR